MGEWAVKQATRAWLEVEQPTKKERIICKIPQRFLEGIGTVLAKSPLVEEKRYIT